MKVQVSTPDEILASGNDYFPLSWEALEANELCIRNLINCFCREVAHPLGLLSTLTLEAGQDWPIELRARVEKANGKVLLIRLPHSELQLAVGIGAGISMTGSYDYLEVSFFRSASSRWKRLDGVTFAELLCQELCLTHRTRVDPDFIHQIRDSLRVTELLLKSRKHLDVSIETFLQAEQSLIFGHPFHPAPKSRPDFTEAEVLELSPESQAQFQLHYFLIRREYLLTESLDPKTVEEILASSCPEGNPDPAFALVPTHPRQAKFLLGLPEIQSLLERDQIRDLGQLGADYFPTSSVRTLFRPGQPYLYKMALTMRITNCIRRNALYDMQNSVEVTRLLRQIEKKYQIQYPHFRTLEEPAYLTVDFKTGNREADTKIVEGFGIILRRDFTKSLDEGTTPVVAASLFGNQTLGRKQIADLMPTADTKEAWFEHYLTLLLPPVLDLYFKEGMMFEPHLQNTLIGLKEGLPQQIFIRDFENVRIIKGSPADRLLGDLSQRARDELLYSEAQGWKRFFYCLIVNHLSETISQIAYNNSLLEVKLWGSLRAHLLRYSSNSHDPRVKCDLDKLLQGRYLPGKGNLMVRFQNFFDRQASYVQLPNPLAALMFQDETP